MIKTIGNIFVNQKTPKTQKRNIWTWINYFKVVNYFYDCSSGFNFSEFYVEEALNVNNLRFCCMWSLLISAMITSIIPKNTYGCQSQITKSCSYNIWLQLFYKARVYSRRQIEWCIYDVMLYNFLFIFITAVSRF